MALFRKDDSNDDLACELRLREEAVERRERNVAERERQVDCREAELEVRQYHMQVEGKELERQGEILVRLKRLIDQRIAEGQLATEVVADLTKQAEQPASVAVPAPPQPSLTPEPPPESKPKTPAKEKVEQAEKLAASMAQQSMSEKLAALKRQVALVTKRSEDAPAQTEATARPTSVFDVDEELGDPANETEICADDTVQVCSESSVLPFGDDNADVIDLAGIGGPGREQIHDQIDAELNRTQNRCRLEAHLLGQREQPAEPQLNQHPTPDMSVLMADRLRFLQIARRSEDALCVRD